MFGNRGSRPKKKVYWDLVMNGEPISPKHQRPKAIGDKLANSHLVSDDDRKFFEDFFEFGDVINLFLADRHVGSRWRIQEL